jgi:pimeloyl-ACP methyl ester carboxylesterase
MSNSVNSRRHRISYRTDGDPACCPLVLLDGFSRWADNWWEVGYVSELRDSYRVIAIDRLGHGGSDKPHDPAEYLEHLIVSDIIAVLDAESVDSALVWGFSMGARNAASLAVMEPARVAALVLGGGTPMPEPGGRRERVMAWAEHIRSEEGLRSWLRSIGAGDDPIEETLAHNDPAALAAAVAGTADWVPIADDIKAPSLWYMGSDDDGGFSAEELEVAARLGVETHSIPGADHVASFRRVDEVVSIVRPFLDRHRL